MKNMKIELTFNWENRPMEPDGEGISYFSRYHVVESIGLDDAFTAKTESFRISSHLCKLMNYTRNLVLQTAAKKSRQIWKQHSKLKLRTPPPTTFGAMLVCTYKYMQIASQVASSTIL